MYPNNIKPSYGTPPRPPKSTAYRSDPATALRDESSSAADASDAFAGMFADWPQQSQQLSPIQLQGECMQPNTIKLLDTTSSLIKNSYCSTNSSGHRRCRTIDLLDFDVEPSETMKATNATNHGYLAALTTAVPQKHAVSEPPPPSSPQIQTLPQKYIPHPSQSAAPSEFDLMDHHQGRRNRTATLESVMAVNSFASTKSVSSPSYNQVECSGMPGNINTRQQHERGEGEGNVVVHGSNNGEMETSMLDHFLSAKEQQYRDQQQHHDLSNWDGGLDNSPVIEVYPHPSSTHSNSNNREELDDASDVSSLSDDERFHAGDEGMPSMPTLKKSNRATPPPINTTIESSTPSAATAPSGGARVMQALWKKPRALTLTKSKLKRSGSTDAGMTRASTVTTAYTSAVHTLDTIDIPSPLGVGGEDTSIFRGMDNSVVSTSRKSPLDGDNSYASLHGYHRRCKTGMAAYNRGAFHGDTDGGIKSSWLTQSLGTSPSSHQHVQWRQQEIDLIDVGDSSDPYSQNIEVHPISLPSPSEISSYYTPVGGVPRLVTSTCETSVISGTSSNGYLPNIGTMSTSSVSLGTGGGQSIHEIQSQPMRSQNRLSRPPIISNRAKTSPAVFDPLSEVNSHMEELSCGSGIPPRYLKDDPLLSKSRYRSPFLPTAIPRKGGRKRQTTPSGSIDGACMFGSIALSETQSSVMSPTAVGLPRRQSFRSVECADSISPATFETSNTPVLMSPSLASVKDATRRENDDDNESCESFTEELNRRDKHKVVVGEMKHFIGRVLPSPKPVVKAGMKLLGREVKSEENALKRAGGCLT